MVMHRTVVSVLLDKISEQSTVEEQSALIRLLISLVSGKCNSLRVKDR